MVERFGGDPAELTSFHVLANYRANSRRIFTRSARRAVRRRRAWVAVEDGSALMGVLPTAILDHVYDVVARNRYRVLRPPRTVPDAASGVPRPLRRVKGESV